MTSRKNGRSSEDIPYGGKVWRGESLANWLVSNIWWKKIWWINRSANRLLIISINLDGFSLANHKRFAKFANVSPCQSFPLYGSYGLATIIRSSVHWTAIYLSQTIECCWAVCNQWLNCNIAAIWDDLLGKLDSLSLQWNSTASRLYQYLKSKLSQYSSHVFTTSVFDVLIISNLVTL